MRHAIVLLAALVPPSLSAQAPQKAPPPPLKEALIDKGREYYSLAFSPDGKALGGGGGRFVRLLDVPQADDGKFVEAKLLSPYGRVDELIFDRAANVLISRSRDQDALVWDAATWAQIRFAIEDGAFGVLPAVPLADGSWLPLAERSRGLRLWRLDGLRRKPRSVTQLELKECFGIGLGHLTATAGASPSLLLGDDQGYLMMIPDLGAAALSREPRRQGPSVPERVGRSPANAHLFRPHAGEISSLAVSAEGKVCVSAGMDGKVRLWSVDKIPLPSQRRPGTKDPDPVWEIAGQCAEMSANGKLLAVADAEGVGVYHAASGIPISWNPTKSTGGRIVRLRFSPDGRYLAGILCRCADCASGERVSVIARRKRLAEHGGTLVVWE